MMFSQFVDGHTSAGIEVLQLSALLVGVALGRTKGRWAEGIQRYGFGGLLALVGLWLLIH